jgi:hypothetical protein
MNYEPIELISLIIMALFIIAAFICIAVIIKAQNDIKKIQDEIRAVEIEEDTVKTAGIADAIMEAGEWMVKVWQEAFCGKLVKLEEDKVYYLAHPCTTGGKSIEENKNKEEELYQRIIRDNPGTKIIRPLTIIPKDMEHEEAMRRCFKLIEAVDGLIFPAEWNKSRGCRMENDRAKIEDKEIIYLKAI